MPGESQNVDVIRDHVHQLAKLEIYIEDLEDIIRTSLDAQEIQDARQRRAQAMQRYNALAGN